MPAPPSSRLRPSPPPPHDLLPGLPNSLVLDCLLPRLPWYTRPLLSSLSKAWHCVLQDPSPYYALTRDATRSALHGLVVVHQLPAAASDRYFRDVRFHNKWMPQPHCLSVYDETVQQWRRIPPIPAFAPLQVLHDCGIASIGNKLFVMGGWDPKTDAVSAEMFELDLGGGLWKWRRRRRMHTAKSLFFCKAVAGKIYVVGGPSANNQREKGPLPEVYDVEKDEWEVLPRVAGSRSLSYNGLAVAGKQVIAFGFRSSEMVKPGELVNFWRLYDPETKRWEDWDCADHALPCSNLLTGEHDLRDGFVNAWDKRSKKWRALQGRVCSKAWRWEGGRRIATYSCCAHNFLVAMATKSPHVYATICEGGDGGRSLNLWRGDLDDVGGLVSWRQIGLPGSLSTCSEMCYLQD